MSDIKWKNMNKALLKYGDQIVELMKQKLQQDKKIATGNLINNIEAYTEDEEDKQFLYVEFPEYGQYVDSGRRPGARWPPRSPIRKWMEQKGIRPVKMTKEQLAFLIQRKIGVRGVPATPFINIFYQHTNELNDLIEDSAAEDLENNINDFVKEYNKNN